MARARNLKPSIFQNEMLGAADPLLTLLFQSLWCLADKEGRLEDRPLRIKAQTFPYREGIDVNGYLTELERLDFIRRYEASGVKVIEVINFKKHQHPHHTEKDSELPAFSTVCEVTVNSPLNNGYAPSDSLLPPTDSLNTESLKQEPPAFQEFLDFVLDGIRTELNLNVVRNEHEWVDACQYGYQNGFSADQLLETFQLVRKQKWRKARVTAKNVADNLTELPKLRVEIEEQENGTDKKPTSERERSAKRVIDGERLADEIAAGLHDAAVSKLFSRGDKNNSPNRLIG
jgi:hypothetical protein